MGGAALWAGPAGRPRRRRKPPCAGGALLRPAEDRPGGNTFAEGHPGRKSRGGGLSASGGALYRGGTHPGGLRSAGTGGGGLSHPQAAAEPPGSAGPPRGDRPTGGGDPRSAPFGKRPLVCAGRRGVGEVPSAAGAFCRGAYPLAGGGLAGGDPLGGAATGFTAFPAAFPRRPAGRRCRRPLPRPEAPPAGAGRGRCGDCCPGGHCRRGRWLPPRS